MIGTFVIGNKSQNLYIIDEHLPMVYRMRLVARPNSPAEPAKGTSWSFAKLKCTIATQAQIDQYKNGKDWPQWVKDILTQAIKPGHQPISQAVPMPVAVEQVAEAYNLNPKVVQQAPLPSVMTLQAFQKNCPHDFVKYVGFSHSYKYCKYCDTKQDMPK